MAEVNEADEAFNELFEEFEAFKNTSHEVEVRQQKTIEELTAENRRLKRLASEADNSKSDYLARLNTAVAAEEDVRTEIHDLKELLTESKKEKVRIENEIEKLSSTHRKQEFTISKLTEERDESADKLIMLESDFSELKGEVIRLRGELLQSKIQLEEAQNGNGNVHHGSSGLVSSKRLSATPTPLPQSLNATATVASLESTTGLQNVAERLKRIADKCRQRPRLSQSIKVGSTTA